MAIGTDNLSLRSTSNPDDVATTAMEALRSLPLGLVVMEPDCTVVYSNEAAEQLLGEPEEQADGRRSFRLCRHDGTPQPHSLLPTTRALETQRVARDRKLELRGPDGVPRVVDMVVAPMTDGRLVAVIEDVTAARAAEQRRRRLHVHVRRVHEIATALSPVRTTREVFDIVLGQVIGGVGATAGLAAVISEDGLLLEVVAAAGYTEEVMERFRTFPASSDLPIAVAARTGKTVVVESIEAMERAFPHLSETARGSGNAAWAAVPLTGESETIGAIGLSFAHHQAFDEDEIAFLGNIGAQCAIALDRTRLAESEAAARAEAEAARSRLAFLADMANVLASSLDPRCTVHNVAAAVVPRLGDICLVSLVDGRGRLRPRVLLDVDPDEEARVREATARWAGRMTAQADPTGVALSGRPELYATVDDSLLARYAVDDAHIDELRALRLSSVLIVPLRARGRTIGTLTVATRNGRTLDPDDLALASEAGDRAGLAIENARLYAEGLQRAQQLQESLLPPRLPVVEGLDLGATYAAAGVGADVGGDFYDVVGLDDGRWLLVIGDVRGKGIDAAAVTGLARHTIRAVAATVSSPAEIMRHLDRALRRADAERLDGVLEPRFATVCAITVVPHDDGARATVCCAGHPLPLLRRSDGSVEAVGRPGTALGMVDHLDLAEVDLELAPGDAVACVTDGLLERREDDRLFEDRLPAVLAAAGGRDAAGIATYLRQAADQHSSAPPSDDMAVLVLRVPSAST